jgi:hypothetical protein
VRRHLRRDLAKRHVRARLRLPLLCRLRRVACAGQVVVREGTQKGGLLARRLHLLQRAHSGAPSRRPTLRTPR